MHYPPPVHGAAMVGQYIKESSAINNDFTCKYINLSTSKTVDEIGKTGIGKWLRYAAIIGAVTKSLVYFKPKLVYITMTATGIGFYKDALFILLAKLFGKNILIHFHNKGVRTRQHKVLDNVLYKMVFKGAKVILLAPQLYTDIEKYVLPNQIYYCSNGIPVVDHVVQQQSVNKTPKLLFLSNLIAAKGVFVLLEACSMLKEKNINFTCTYVGGEGDVSAKTLQSKINDLQLEGVVSYVGRKYGEEKYAVYNGSDIFVLPTYYANECFPLVLLEAMQFSLPMVTTAGGGIGAIIDEGINGFMVPTQDAKAIAEKLELLIENPDLRNKMGVNALAKYEEKFTLEKFEQRFIEIISNAIQ